MKTSTAPSPKQTPTNGTHAGGSIAQPMRGRAHDAGANGRGARRARQHEAVVPSDPVPIVYVETNWLVALAFPHDQFHRRAAQLRDAGASRRCEIRLPLEAQIEAHSVGRKPSELHGLVAKMRDLLSNAIQNGNAELAVASAATRDSDLETYLTRNASAAMDAGFALAGATTINFKPELIDVIEDLRLRVKYAGRDLVDLVILASPRSTGARRPEGPAGGP